MGKSSKPKVTVTFFYMSQHFGVCSGPVDEVQEIKIKEKTAWTGAVAANTTLSINERELFGGDQKEGGAIGLVDVYMGEQNQVLNDPIAQRLGRASGADCPGFRGLTSLFFYRNTTTDGFYWSANAPFLPGVWVRLKRILKRSDGTAQWYPSKAQITRGVETVVLLARNSAAWKYFTEPDTTIGTDYSAADFDDSSWSLGTAPFYKGSPHPSDEINDWGYGSGTAIGDDLDVWMRRTISTTAGTLLTVNVASDDSASVWANGVPVTLSATGDWTSEGTFIADSDTVVIAVRVQDSPATGTDNYIFADIEIAVPVISGDMNPAHIIHETLTNTDWGMGTSVAGLDDAAFTAVADTLFDEGLGLSIIWREQLSIEDFVQEVLDHIKAVQYADPRTGLQTIKLIRGDYDVGTLDALTPSNADLTNYSRKLWGEIVNEIVVTWTNPENEETETLSVQDDASIAMQGIVSDGRNYYGVRSAALAQDLAYRELRAAGQPLVSCSAELDRTLWDLTPGDVVKLTWPEYSITDLVMRVQTVDYGSLGDSTIKVELIEDVFGLDVGEYGNPPSSQWVDPAAPPEDIPQATILTMPYFFALGSEVAEFVDSPTYAEVVAGILATSSNTDAWSYELWDEVTLPDASLEYQAIATNNIIGNAELVASLPLEDTTVGASFTNKTGDTSPIQSGFVIVGDGTPATDEICLVTADNGNGTFDLKRGVLDTVPRTWAAGTKVWFVDEGTLWEDPEVRAAGETVDYKLLMRTSQGLFELASATEVSETLTDRPWLPNRPANVEVEGTLFSSPLFPVDVTGRPNAWVTVDWSNRNRLDEENTVLAWTDADMTVETGQTTTIEVRAEDGTLLATHDSLAGVTFNVPDGSFGSESLIELRVFAERSDADGDFVSLQYSSHWLLNIAARRTESGSLRRQEDGTTIRVVED